MLLYTYSYYNVLTHIHKRYRNLIDYTYIYYIYIYIKIFTINK